MPSTASLPHSDRIQIAMALSGNEQHARHSAVDGSHKTWTPSRPSQLSLSNPYRASKFPSASSNSTTMTVGKDVTENCQGQLHTKGMARGDSCIQAHNLRMTSAVACSTVSSGSSASSSSSDDGHSVEGTSHHEESGFVSAASSVCLDAETPDIGLTPVSATQPPKHRPKPSALSLPGCEEVPLHDNLVSASKAAPTEVEVVVLADFNPCCDVELKVVQGQYATALFQRGAWLYVRVASCDLQPAREGYVPVEYCNLALLSPGTLDELSNDFDAMGDPFSPPKQLVVFNSLTTSSPLSATAAAEAKNTPDCSEPVLYEVANVQRRTSQASNPVNPRGSQSSGIATPQTSQASPSTSNSRRHSYIAQSDTEGYGSQKNSVRSKSFLSELNVRTRKLPGKTRSSTTTSSTESRPRSCSYATHRAVESDYETWAGGRDRSVVKSSKQQHSKYESDCESVVGSVQKRSNTLSEVPQSKSSRSRLVERLKNFRSRGSTLKLSAVDEPSTLPPKVGQVPVAADPLPSAFDGRRAHAIKDKSSTGKSQGYTSDTEVFAGAGSKLSKGSKKRSIFSSLRRLNTSQTDTEDNSHSRKRWKSLHVTKKEKMKSDQEKAEKMNYSTPPMRRQSSLPRLSSERPAETLSPVQRKAMVYLPCMAVCNFIGKPQLGQVSLKEGQRVFRLVPPNDSNGRKPKQSSWVMVLDPWTKREGMVPQSCLSTMSSMSQSTML